MSAFSTVPDLPAAWQGGPFPGAPEGVWQGAPGPKHPDDLRATLDDMAEQRHNDSGGTELGRFLRARRTQVTPAEVGFTPSAGVRRTPGLRREEVAALAGVSIDYYTRLERGKETRPSLSVVDALGRALKLDTDELEHLQDLVIRAARHAPEPPPAPSRAVNPQATLLLESLRPNPAYVTSRTLDLLAHNPGALALYAGIEDWPAKQRNLARFMFLHPAARDLYADWDTQLVGCVARLRALAGTDPDAPDLANLIGELLLKSPDFAKLWDRYQVTRSPHTRKPKTFHHPQVGDITLNFQGMQLEGTPGHRLGVYVTTPGTPEHDAVVLLDMTAPQHTSRPAQAAPGQSDT